MPVQKNDPTGQCVSRGHPCICQTGSPNALCPFHALQRHQKRLAHVFPNTPTDQLPFIPSDTGTFIAKADTMKIFSLAIEVTGTPLTRPGPHGEPLPRYGEHVCRVSGAQFLSRLRYSFEAIQLIGRWGSDAVKRYIQEAPLTATPSNSLTPTSSQQTDIRDLVRTELERLCNSWWILSSHSNTAHIPAVPETSQNNRCVPCVVGTMAQPNTTRPSADLRNHCVASASGPQTKMTMVPPLRTKSLEPTRFPND